MQRNATSFDRTLEHFSGDLCLHVVTTRHSPVNHLVGHTLLLRRVAVLDFRQNKQSMERWLTTTSQWRTLDLFRPILRADVRHPPVVPIEAFANRLHKA